VRDSQLFIVAAFVIAHFLRELFQALDLFEAIAIECGLVFETFLEFFADLSNLARAIEVFLMVLFSELDLAFGAYLLFEGCQRTIVWIPETPIA
jgi:hypothetical protein